MRISRFWCEISSFSLFSAEKISADINYGLMPLKVSVAYKCFVWLNYAKNNNDTIEKCKTARTVANECFFLENDTSTNNTGSIPTTVDPEILTKSSSDRSETSTEPSQ